MLQVLERECSPELLAKKKAKLEGKRVKDYKKVSLHVLLLCVASGFAPVCACRACC